MNNTAHPKPVVGIIGGGQLAQLLVQAAKPLQVSTSVFVASLDEPAAHCADAVMCGTIGDDAFKNWLKTVDVLTFENEFVNCQEIESASIEARKGLGTLPCYPTLSTLIQLQNKLFQKQLLFKLDIPTSPFIFQEASEADEVFLRRAFTALGARCVLKWANYGYDGKGVFVVRKHDGSLSPRQQQDNTAALSFLKTAHQKKTVVYAEEYINHSCEVAMVATRRNDGEMVFYPLVHSKQAAGVCSQVVGPAEHFGINQEFVAKAEHILKRIGEATRFVGSFAVEFFVTPGGGLLVNEVAPRVHNSGHYTLNACKTSQFENHLRAVLNLDLGSTALEQKYFGMQNILGSSSAELNSHLRPIMPSSAEVNLYWYGKNRLSPGRKMGHINITAPTRYELFKRLETANSFVRQWEQSLLPRGRTSQ